MSCYDLVFKFSLDAITEPIAPQRGGVAGDNDCATVTFEFADAGVYESLFKSEGVSLENPRKYFYCIEVNDAIGAYDATELREFESGQQRFSTDIATAWTSPGMASLRLVLIKQNAEGDELWRWHSVPAYVYFDNRDNGEKMVAASLYEWQTTLAKAEAAAASAEKFAAAAKADKEGADAAFKLANEFASAAQVSSGKAEEKEREAQEAASEAYHSATVAAAKEVTATESAEAAEGFKNDAEAAQTAAESFKNDAEQFSIASSGSSDAAIRAADSAYEFQRKSEDAAGLAQSYSADAEMYAQQAVSAAKDAQEYLQHCGNALIGTTAGERVTLPDVSPVEHEIQVVVRSKNLVNNADFLNPDCWINDKFPLTTKPNTVYTLSWSYKGTAPLYFYLRSYSRSEDFLNNSGTVREAFICGSGDPKLTLTFTASADREYYLFLSDSNTFINEIEYFQLEEGVVASPYTPFVEDLSLVSLQKYGNDLSDLVASYTPNANGSVEGVTSIYPTTTITTDTEGALVEVQYHRDLNKAFESLVQAIISLGGNV